MWTSLPPLPSAVSDETANDVGTSIYIAGGCSSGNICDPVKEFCYCTATTNAFTVFDTITRTYAALPPMPIARYRHIACVVDDTIFYFGGRDASTDAILTSVDAFNTKSLKWSTLDTTYPSDLGTDNSCSAVGDSIYIFGGYSSTYDKSFNTTYRFTPAGSSGVPTWSRLKGQLATGRGDFASVALNGHVHVYGGYSVNKSISWACAPISSHEVYDPKTDSYAPAEPLPLALGEKDDGVVLDGLIVSVGGETKSVSNNCPDQTIVPLRNVFLYDSKKNTWTDGPPLPDARMRYASSTVGGTLYTFGGQGTISDAVVGNTFILPVFATAFAFAPPVPSPPAVAPPVSFSSGSIAGAVLGTFFSTLLVIALLVLSRRCCYSRAAADAAASDKNGLLVVRVNDNTTSA